MVSRLNGKKLFLFDFDGVLIDSRKNMMISWNSCRKKFKLKPNFNDYFSQIGKPFKVILDDLGIDVRMHRKIAKEFNNVSIKNFKKIKLYPNSKKVLKKLKNKGYILGLITSKDRKRVSSLVSKFGLNFHIILCPVNRRYSKPHPYQVNSTIKKFKLKKEQAVFVGDMAADKLTAKNALIDFVYSKYGYGKLGKQKYSIRSINEILKVNFN